jgi:4,5-DOPA dioxygenase extradiol
MSQGEAPYGRMPVLFIGHGSPMNIIQDNAYTRSLPALAAALPRPSSILVISAHWLTEGTFVTDAARPRQIYDFYGFPDELYAIRYEPQGAPQEAKQLSARSEPPRISLDNGQWGLDHASWAVLCRMYPKGDVPVWEMSLDIALPAAKHVEVARALADLRNRSVLIIGSGNLVHNLRIIDFKDNAAPFPWAMEADYWFKQRIESRDLAALCAYDRAGPAVRKAIPTNDHYLPMLYALALADAGEPLTFTHEGIQNGSISMRCFRIG